MPYELDAEIRSRLIHHYQQVSDEELLQAAVKADDLTPMAQEVVHAELSSRGLGGAWSEATAKALPSEPSHPLVRDPLSKPEFGEPLERGKTVLVTLDDAITAGEACDYLEKAGITFDLQQVPLTTVRRGTHADGGAVRLRLIVRTDDYESSVRLLREKLSLFPVESVSELDKPEDDGTKITLGVFARRSDAEDVARVLNEAGVWNIVKPNPDGSVENEDAFLVGVREVDLVGAGELVEKALNLPEA